MARGLCQIRVMVIEKETGFCVRSLVIPSRRIFPRHAHRNGHLVMVYDGEWSDLAGPRRRILRRGEALFHPAGMEHETVAADGTEVIVVGISQAVLDTFPGLYDRTTLIRFSDVDEIPDRIHAELAHADSATALLIHSLILQLLAIGSRTATKPARRKPDWMSRLVAYIHANLGRRLTVQRLAAEAGVSESHLSHGFQQYFGGSVSDYIRDARLRAAARALRLSGDSVQQIAWNFGFSDQAHFSRTFKSAYGVAPTEYRSARTAWADEGWPAAETHADS